MLVKLSKGEKVSLSKKYPSLKKIRIGLGWDTNKYDGEFDFDLDASAFLLKSDNKIGNERDFIFYNNLTHPTNCIVHTGDNRTGVGDGDDEALWDAGFNLDDWDVCFVSNVPLTQFEDGYKEPIDEAWWLVSRMENWCVGYEHVEYGGKHFYITHHS